MSDVKPATDAEREDWLTRATLSWGAELRGIMYRMDARIDAEKARADAAEQKLWDASVRHGQDLKRIAALEEEKEREEGFTNDYIKHLHKAQERIAALEAGEKKLLAAAKAYRDLGVCYRVGKQPSEALLKRLDKAKAEMGDE